MGAGATVIKLNSDIKLTGYRTEDAPALVNFLNEPDIHSQTLRIPTPYTIDHALEWIDSQLSGENPSINDFVIRHREHGLIGGIGLMFHEMDALNHSAELGYWLGGIYRNSGIATLAVGAMVTYAFTELGLQRISACVFTDNPASEKVLTKNGFILEGQMKHYYKKDDQLLDARLFARIATQGL